MLFRLKGKSEIGNKRISKYGFLLLVLVIGFCVPAGKAVCDETEGTDITAKLSDCLRRKENLIDYAEEGRRVFAIVSSMGEERYGDCLVVMKENRDGSYQEEYRNDFTGLKPWKLELADIDGDGVTDLLTGVRKKTHYDAEEKNRLFVFDYIEGKLVKKWTGSQIAGTWRDFYVKDILPVKGAEVLFLSQTEEGEDQLGIYYWFQFGFLILAQSEEYETIEEVSFTDAEKIRIKCGKDRKEWIDLTIKDGRMIRSINQD